MKEKYFGIFNYIAIDTNSNCQNLKLIHSRSQKNTKSTMKLFRCFFAQFNSQNWTENA